MTRSSDSWAAAFLAAAMRDAAAVEIEADSGRAVGLDPAAAPARWRLPQFAPRAAASAATRCGVEELGGMARGSLVGAVGITDLPAAQNSPCGWLLRGEMTRPAVAPLVLRILARRKRCCPSRERADRSRRFTATHAATIRRRRALQLLCTPLGRACRRRASRLLARRYQPAMGLQAASVAAAAAA